MRDLRMTFLPQFRQCVEAGSYSFMCSYNRYTLFLDFSVDNSAMNWSTRGPVFKRLEFRNNCTKSSICFFAKHYQCGAPCKNSGRNFPSSSIEALSEFELSQCRPRRTVFSTNIWGFFFRINGVPACANEWLLTDLLRNEWGFDGYVVSDEGAIEWMLIFHNYTDTIRETAAEAVNAGNVKIKRIQERYKNTWRLNVN